MTEAFFARDALVVARDVLGKILVHGAVELAITEVEAYRWPTDGAAWRDSANHCRAGRTPRNAAMWGPPGRAYVYLCYGMHAMLNLVTGEVDQGAAVLIRGAAPLAGLDLIRQRRRLAPEAPLELAGPGKVAAALGLDPSFCHHPLCEPGGLEVRDGPAPRLIVVGPRVGIDYATARDRRAAWRLADADSPHVSHRRSLRPARAGGIRPLLG